MGRVFAIADLHLSLSGQKPMHVFGELWRDHDRRMAEQWDSEVRADDTVLLPGDLSWARNAVEAEPDLAWIAERPGRKILLKGNHDSWWTTPGKVTRLLAPGCEPLQNVALELGDWVLVGARGWTAPDDPRAEPADEKTYRRELERLRLSLADADRRFGKDRRRIAMVHFPPRLVGQDPSPVVRLLTGGGVSVCVYGHLHGEDHALALDGLHDGIHYHFVAADAIGFAPRRIPLDGCR